MDTAGVSGVVLPVASQGFVITARNAPSSSASKSGLYLPYRETGVSPESSSKVIPAFAELPHAGHCVEAYNRNQVHTMASVTISQKPQVFYTGNAALSAAAASDTSAFHGIPGSTLGSGHQMLQPAYPGMVMPVRGLPYPSPGMPIAYQKPQVFPGLSNKPPHL